jgi:RNA polymerase sigma factor (sigma-70 family)
MDTHSDMQLLGQFAESGAHELFAQLVERRIDLVYSAAMRQVRDAHLAQDVTQGVFVILARKARSVAGSHASLAAWLLTTTHWVAMDALRKLARRRKHERKAAQMITEVRDVEESTQEIWERLAPRIDAALAGLPETDRTAIVLRYVDDKSLREVAAELGVSEAAAKQRVFRAVEKLRKSVGAHGLSAGAMGSAITAHAVAPAPAGLAQTTAIGALAATAPTVATLVKGAIWIMAWNKMKVSIVAAALLIAAAPAAVVTYRWISRSPAPRPPLAPAVAVVTQPVALATMPSGDWRSRFDAVYRLDDGQTLKRIAPPYIPERTQYFDQQKLSAMFDMSGGICVFQVEEDGRAQWNRWTGHKPPTIEELLKFVAGVPRYKLEMDEFERMAALEGDWVIRKGATEEECVVALAREISLASPHAMAFEKRTVERDVYIARGDYKPTGPSPEPGEPPLISLYLDKPRAPDNHSAGDVHSFLISLGETMNTEVIDETDHPKQQGVYWTNNVSGGVARGFQWKLLNNVTVQTGITFTPARRPREIWVAIIDKP